VCLETGIAREEALVDQHTLTEHVEKLELRVDALQELPGRMTALETRVGAVEEQILHLRGEMKGEFSEVRLEMRALHAESLAQSRLLYEDLKEQIKLLGNGRRKRTR
jgi:hypothetical protein